MPISEYYLNLRKKIGSELIFNPSVAAIIRNRRGEILFQRPSLNSDIWSLPAGAIEIGETPAEAVVREVWEETGLKVSPTKVIGIFGGKDFRFTYPDGNQVEYIIVMFECTINSGNLEAVDGESAELQFFNVDSIPKLAIPYPREVFYPSSSERTLF
ncbi:NUDIX domain-containing protein [Paenibacillus sp. SN-8-1]|uniref:NUDIX domain-containing protein n=1 Tax=Paenibacillus sp. SN-8-1 TaxID=3435409 RepID=UPI003D9AB4EC